MKEKRPRSELYGTKEVAQILGIPEWRVKNFSEGAAYRLPPAHQVGRGRGSRRLYGWEDIFRLGIANRLVNFGFTPESVGDAIREIPASALAPYRAHLEAHEPQTGGQLKSKETPLLVQLGGVKFGGVWKVMKASEVHSEWVNTIKHGGDAADKRSVRQQLFVLNVANVCDSIFDALNRYWTGGKRSDLQERLR
jgi:hypothetical protein